MASRKSINILSIDLEDYFMVSAFESCVKREDWDKHESRIERNTYRLLEIFNESPSDPQSRACNSISATFFCLGWVAERYPHLIKEIHTLGHEIASHGYDHRMITLMSREEFREDVHRAKAILEDLIGQRVIGYRAPSYSITHQTFWALDILAQEGYCYDSSIFPIRHDMYGIPSAPRFPFAISLNGNSDLEVRIFDFDFREPSDFNPQSTIGNQQWIMEFPLSTVRMFNVNIPIAGGGYFRLFPYRMLRSGLRRINRQEDRPFVFYLHPWEIDPQQPRIAGVGMKSTFRHYVNLGKTEKRFTKLLEDFQFSSVREYIARQSPVPNAAPPPLVTGNIGDPSLQENIAFKKPTWI